jgi:hypothetical protein
MAKLGEVILLPCQFCGRMERREAKWTRRAMTCFECKSERNRKTAREQQRFRRANLHRVFDFDRTGEPIEIDADSDGR